MQIIHGTAVGAVFPSDAEIFASTTVQGDSGQFKVLTRMTEALFA